MRIKFLSFIASFFMVSFPFFFVFYIMAFAVMTKKR